MFLRVVTLAVSVCAFSAAASYGGDKKASPSDRVLEKLAAKMLQSHPELKQDSRSKEAHAKLVKELRGKGAAKLSEKYYQKLKRRTADYESFAWKKAVRRFKKAQFVDAKSKFLLAKAKSQKLSSVEQYVVQALLNSLYEEQVQQRVDISKKRLRDLGLAYTVFAKEHKRAPSHLDELQLDEEVIYAVNPHTGDSEPWIYVGSGPVMMKGSNNYRVVAYSPFQIGKKLDSRWVGYKGGRVSEWKSTTVRKKHFAMYRANETAFTAFLNKAIELKKEVKKKPLLSQNRTEKKPVPDGLKITIKELW